MAAILVALETRLLTILDSHILLSNDKGIETNVV